MYELRRSYIGVFAALVLVATGVAAGVAFYVFDDLMRSRQVEEANLLAKVLANSTDEALSEADLIASGLSSQLGLNNLVDQDGLRSIASSRMVFDRLQNRAPSLKQLDVITITDLTGQILNFSRSFPAPNINLRDRDYFQAHLADPALEYYLSEPVQNRGNGQWTFYLARKVRAADGSMIGMFLVGLKADYFVANLIASGANERYVYRLLRDGGAVLAQSDVSDGSETVSRSSAGTSYPFVAELLVKHPPYAAAELKAPAGALGFLIVLISAGAYLVKSRENVSFTRVRRIRRENEGLKERTSALKNELVMANARLGELDTIARNAGRIDPLTGLPDRNYAQQFCEFFAAETQSQPLSALVFDIRGLAAINVESGFEAGNEALRRVGRFLRAECRPADFVGRIGGDEFVIIMPEAGEGGMHALSERLRAQFLSEAGLSGLGLSVTNVTAVNKIERGGLLDLAQERLRVGRTEATGIQVWAAEVS